MTLFINCDYEAIPAVTNLYKERLKHMVRYRRGTMDDDDETAQIRNLQPSCEDSDGALLSSKSDDQHNAPVTHRWSTLVCYIVPVFLIVLVYAIVDSALMILTPLYTKDAFIAGLVITFIGIGMVSASPFMGGCIDRTSAEFVVIAASLVRTAALVALSFFPDFTASWIAFAFIYGLTVCAFQICVNVFMARWIPTSRRGRSAALINGGRRIGNCIGPMIAGHLSTFTMSMMTTITVSMMSILVVCCLMVPPSFVMHPHDATVPDGSCGSFKHLKAKTIGIRMCNLRNWIVPRHNSGKRQLGMVYVWRHYGKSLLMISIFSVGLNWVRISRKLLLTFRAQEMGLTKGQIGSVSSISYLPESVLFPFAGYLMDKYGRKATAIPGLTLFVVALSLISWTMNFEMLAGLGVVFGFADGITAGLLMALIADIAPTEGRSEFLGQYQIFCNLAKVLGPVVIGTLCAHTSLRTAALSSAIVGAFTLFWISCIMKEPRIQSQSEKMLVVESSVQEEESDLRRKSMYGDL